MYCLNISLKFYSQLKFKDGPVYKAHMRGPLLNILN